MSFPSGINKIIEEYCYYPKKYLEELEQQTVRLRNGIDIFNWDLSYSWILVKGMRSENGPSLGNGYPNNDIRNVLITKQDNRRLEFGIKDNSNTNRGYYPY